MRQRRPPRHRSPPRPMPAAPAVPAGTAAPMQTRSASHAHDRVRWPPAFPRQIGRRLAAGVRQLDADRHRRPASYRLQHLGQGLLGRIVVQTKIGVTDAPFRHHRRRFENQQAGARLRQGAQVDAVPIAGAAVLCRVLAHRRNDNPVGERERTEGDGENNWLKAASTADMGCLLHCAARAGTTAAMDHCVMQSAHRRH